MQMDSVASIKSDLEALSFPRLYGSEDEKKASLMIKEKITSLNLSANVKSFEFSNFYSIIYGRLMFTSLFVIMIILYFNLGGIIQDITLILTIGVFILLIIIARKPETIRIGKKFHSQNIYTNIENKNIDNKSPLNVIFISHIDTKGQRFNITHRVKAYITWLSSLLVAMPLVIIKNLVPLPFFLSAIFYIIGGIALILNFIAVLILYLNKIKNHSNGALDNASGTACLLELMNYYAKDDSRQLNNIKLWFLFTGAEECGTMGIRNFHQNIMNGKMRKSNTLVINFDSIGLKADLIKFGFTRHKKSNFLERVMKEAEEAFKYELPTHNVPIGVHTDGYYLFKKGYDGIEFGDWDSYRYLHSMHDTIDKVDPVVLKDICNIVIHSLSNIDPEL